MTIEANTQGQGGGGGGTAAPVRSDPPPVDQADSSGRGSEAWPADGRTIGRTIGRTSNAVAGHRRHDHGRTRRPVDRRLQAVPDSLSAVPDSLSAVPDDSLRPGEPGGRLTTGPERDGLRLLRAAPTETPLDQASRWPALRSVEPGDATQAGADQQPLALVLPFRRDGASRAQGAGRSRNFDVRTGLDPVDLPINRRRTRRDDLPEPAAWSRVLIPRLLEVVDGRRPAGQIRPWADDRVLATLTVIAAGARRRATVDIPQVVRSMPPCLRSVHVCEPADGVAEVAARFTSGDRSRALALRLEGRDGRWCAVSIRLG